MPIDTKALPDGTVVETVADHFPQKHLTTALDVHERGDLTITRVFVPVPDGVTVEDAESALAAIVPADPDAAWIEAIAKELHGRDTDSQHSWDRCQSSEKYRSQAREFLSVAREVGL